MSYDSPNGFYITYVWTPPPPSKLGIYVMVMLCVYVRVSKLGIYVMVMLYVLNIDISRSTKLPELQTW